jgi:hypothetical protein
VLCANAWFRNSDNLSLVVSSYFYSLFYMLSTPFILFFNASNFDFEMFESLSSAFWFYLSAKS